SSRRRHTRWPRDWSSDVCSSDLLRHNPLGVIGRPDAQSFALLDAQRDQSAGETIDFGLELAIGVAQTWWQLTSASRSRCDSATRDRKSTRLNSSHVAISYAVFCL